MKALLKWMWKERGAYTQIAPALIILIFMSFIPILWGIGLGLTDFSFLRPRQTSFVGLKNVIEQLYSFRYWVAVVHTIYYTGMATGLCYILGLVVALLLNARKLKAKNVFRVAVLLPWTITPAVVGIIWTLMLRSRYGLVNLIFARLGLPDVNFLGDTDIVMEAMLLPTLWGGVPFAAILLLARLQAIPSELYEAATVDGATGWQRLLYITLPQLKGISMLVLLFMAIGYVKVFDIIWILTKGGPGHSSEVVMIYIYDLAFQRWDMGAASAAIYLPTVIVFLLGYLYIRLFEKER